jgi:hypothetical protein
LRLLLLPHLLLSLLLLSPLLSATASSASSSVAHGQAPPGRGGRNVPGCTSANDYGWPRFNNSSELTADVGWAEYFMLQYGELPTFYPVCVFDLHMLNVTNYNKAGLSGSRPVVNSTGALQVGDLFISPILGYGIYHEEWRPVPNNTWVEVTHSVFPTELVGAWVWSTHGSGVWVNVGKTKVFPTPADMNKIHAEAIAWLREGCRYVPCHYAACAQFGDETFQVGVVI